MSTFELWRLATASDKMVGHPSNTTTLESTALQEREEEEGEGDGDREGWNGERKGGRESRHSREGIRNEISNLETNLGS